MEMTLEKRIEVVHNIRSYCSCGLDEALYASFDSTADECGSTYEEIVMIQDYLENLNISGYLIIEDNDKEYRLAI